MFDDESFARSKLYFGSIQLLRVFSDWIEESKADFEHLLKDTTEYLGGIRLECTGEGETEVNTKPFLSAIEKSAKEQEIRFQALLDRIKKKQSDINSLRGGVSSFRGHDRIIGGQPS